MPAIVKTGKDTIGTWGKTVQHLGRRSIVLAGFMIVIYHYL